MALTYPLVYFGYLPMCLSAVGNMAGAAVRLNYRVSTSA